MTVARESAKNGRRTCQRRRVDGFVPIAVAVLVCTSFAHAAEPVLTGNAILEKGKKLYSQGNEELVIRHFFQDRRGGFFLDVGAYHWKKASTTLYLEDHLGWSGIAIDAQRTYAKGYAKHRPRTRFFAYLVSDKSGGSETLYEAGPLSSTDPTHLDVFQSHPDRFPGADKIESKPMQVRTVTLDQLLTAEKVEKIDFLSMDIEGSEPPALRGFDIERYRPDLVCIEVSLRTADKIAPYFEEHGYERIMDYEKYDAVNWYYRPKKPAEPN